MLVRPNERAPIARLLQFLEAGERLAHDCAQAQAGLASDSRVRRFLLGQARQEAMHAWVFQGAIAWLAPRQLGACPLLQPLERYRVLLRDALQQGHFAETLLAEQIILEGLGKAILQRIEAGLVKRRAAFGRLRRILLHQEEAHHGFGTRLLDRMIAAGDGDPEQLRSRGQDYLALAHDMVTTLTDLFDSIDEDASAWTSDLAAYVPSWLRSFNSSNPSLLAPHSSPPL
jgi:rubrerythrin